MGLPEPRPQRVIGHAKPRLAPPTPARSRVKEFEAAAKDIGISLIPWQKEAGRYIYATGRADRWLYPEVAAIVSRQNGKTRLLKPHVVHRLRMNRRILHAAQTRELPRKFFFDLLPDVQREFPDARIRKGAGQETIELPTGGFYTISAASSGGPRGLSIDDVLVDELREIDEDFIAAALPTVMASTNPQILYLSNAGSDDSIALNALRSRRDDDPALAYLEWSAAPDRLADDVEGWAEANPSLGHFPMLHDNLVRAYRSNRLAGTLAHFETENLCRWVSTMRERLVDEFRWATGRRDEIGAPIRPSIGVSMDPAGRRASVALAWRVGTEILIQVAHDAQGEPIKLQDIGELVGTLSRKYGARVGYDPLTDAELAKFAPKGKAESIAGPKYANASARFVQAVDSDVLRWSADAEVITGDLTWTARKPDGEPGHFHAVRAKDDHPVTAALAAIRAVWLASGPTAPLPRIG